MRDIEWPEVEPCVRKIKKSACKTCDHIHPRNAARAVGLFDRSQPVRFISSLGGPIRPTRAEAERDWCGKQAAA